MWNVLEVFVYIYMNCICWNGSLLTVSLCPVSSSSVGGGRSALLCSVTQSAVIKSVQIYFLRLWRGSKMCAWCECGWSKHFSLPCFRHSVQDYSHPSIMRSIFRRYHIIIGLARASLDVIMQQLDAGVHDPCVPLVQGEVGVLPRVPAVVVQLQPHDVRPVVPGHRVLPSVE